jgi:hypothetical protein
MKRKLVQQGQHCLMAAIPKKWLTKQQLGKGDSVEFEEIENYLLVSAKPLPREKEISIELKETSRVGVYRVLQLLYDAGFKTVRVKFDKPEMIPLLLWAIRPLSEWRLENVSTRQCILKTIMVERQAFQPQFRRIFLLTKDLVETFTLYIQGNVALLDDIRAKHIIIIEGCMNLRRMINTSALPLEYKYYYFILTQLEEIVDHYEYLSRYLERKKAPSDLVPFQKKLATFFNETYQNFYSFRIDWFTGIAKQMTWKWFETEKHPLLIYHLRAISERTENIAKFTVGIRLT